VLDVKHIAMARSIAPGGLLPGAQALSCIGNRIFRIQPLLGGVKQMHAPGIGIAALRLYQKIAIRRRRIDTGKHGHRAMEKLVLQAYTNARQVLAEVDGLSQARHRLKHMVNGAHAGRHDQHGHA